MSWVQQCSIQVDNGQEQGYKLEQEKNYNDKKEILNQRIFRDKSSPCFAFDFLFSFFSFSWNFLSSLVSDFQSILKHMKYT